ncbi:hypothetical protein D3C87_2205570 [compost metagenome]
MRICGTLAVSKEAGREGTGNDGEDNEDQQRHHDDRRDDLQDAAQGKTKHERFHFGHPDGRDN